MSAWQHSLAGGRIAAAEPLQADVDDPRLGTSALYDIIGSCGDIPNLSAVLHQSGLGAASLVCRSAPYPPKAGSTSRAQVMLPLAGLFSCIVGRSRTIVDVNTALFARPGQEFTDAPLHGPGHASAVLTPNTSLLDELTGRLGCRELFALMTRPASARAQLLAHCMVGLNGHPDNSEGDELFVGLLLELAGAAASPAGSACSRVVLRAKEYVHGLLGAKLSLEEAAREVGVTPIYLTQTFKASEGVPLYRYHLNLRLSRSLARLPYCESIIALALDLGFSSHSHFSAAFMARYGQQPSGYRETARARSCGGPATMTGSATRG